MWHGFFHELNIVQTILGQLLNLFICWVGSSIACHHGRCGIFLIASGRWMYTSVNVAGYTKMAAHAKRTPLLTCYTHKSLPNESIISDTEIVPRYRTVQSPAKLHLSSCLHKLTLGFGSSLQGLPKPRVSKYCSYAWVWLALSGQGCWSVKLSSKG